MFNKTQKDRLNREIEWHLQNIVPHASMEPLLPETIERYKYTKNANLFIKEFAIRQMGTLEGKRVLDFGCGAGRNSILFAKLGAYVHGIDLSPELVSIAAQNAKINGVVDRVSFTVSAIENYYPEQKFDIIFGSSILHHLDLKNLHPLYFSMIKKSLIKPGGFAIFTEPVCLKPWLSQIRNYIPVSKEISPDERQLGINDIELIKMHFTHVEIKYFRLFGRLDRFLKNRTKIDRGHPFTRYALTTLYFCDRILIDYFPGTNQYCGNVVLICRI